jgi:hypothetical protein
VGDKGVKGWTLQIGLILDGHYIELNLPVKLLFSYFLSMFCPRTHQHFFSNIFLSKGRKTSLKLVSRKGNLIDLHTNVGYFLNDFTVS